MAGYRIRSAGWIGAGMLALSGAFAVAEDQAAAEEWRHYAREATGTRFSPLKQINTGNAASLQRAWTYRTGDMAKGGAHYAECTPLVVDGVMYLITPFSRLIALDATTGSELWRFSPDPPLDHRETGAGGLASRGLAYSDLDDRGRIFLPVRDGRIYAIDTETHAPDPGFGEQGQINLREGLGDAGRNLFLSSPPALYRNVLLQPYGIDDTSARHVGYVPLRAFDARTGALLWTFHTIAQPGQAGHETWAGNSWQDRGGCNPWAPLSVDEDRGIFYVPIGAPNSDKYGGDRPGDNLYANALVALDALTGTLLWHFQTVHHDLWDYDLPAQPNLFEAQINGGPVPAVAVAGKTGFVYVFNRVTGEALFPMEERPVPASDVSGEVASPTQPFPLKPPPFARQRLTQDDLVKISSEGHEALKKTFAGLRSEGLFTPPSAGGTIVLPGQLGGANWSGASVSPDGMMYITANELPYVSRVQAGRGPYGASPSAGHFLDDSGYPAITPPWGTITKLDLNRGELLWQRPLGDFEALGPEWEGASGQMNFGGATATGGGLVFAAASMDGKLRAFDAADGAVLFETQLEAAGYGAPITYMGRDGKQYLCIFAGGGGKARTTAGDYVIAFRLP